MPLTDIEFRRALEAEEDAYLERKPDSAKREEIRRTLVAFANSVEEGRLGVLLIGVGDKGQVLGVQDTDGKQKYVRQIGTDDCYPPIDCQPQVFEVKGMKVVAVTIGHSGLRPHFAGPAFVRRGSQSINATRELYEDLIASRNDKCRAIQGWRAESITLLEDGYRLDRGPVQGGWRAKRECRIVTCDAHTVRLRDLSSDERFTVSINQIDIGYDEREHRNQLRVHP